MRTDQVTDQDVRVRIILKWILDSDLNVKTSSVLNSLSVVQWRSSKADNFVIVGVKD